MKPSRTSFSVSACRVYWLIVEPMNCAATSTASAWASVMPSVNSRVTFRGRFVLMCQNRWLAWSSGVTIRSGAFWMT